jgi:hypothetical protein
VVNGELAGKNHPRTGIRYDKYGFPIFDYYLMLVMPEDDILDSKKEHESLFNVDLAMNCLSPNSELEIFFRKRYIEKFDEVVRNFMERKKSSWVCVALLSTI